MQAVILAAGMGSRIRAHHALPKGFIRVGERSIIEASIEKLKQQGINKILIVTGYQSAHYEALAQQDEAVTTIHNPRYADTSSLYSLYCAKGWVTGDFLLLESDLLYESRALSAICEANHPNIILLSGETQSGDEVYVQADHHHLVNMSKQADHLNQEEILGEFVGINKLCFGDYQTLLKLVENNTELLNSGHYEEDGLVALSAESPIYCLKISDLLWCEIDDANHLQRAKQIFENM